MYQKSFGGRAPPGPAGKLTALPQTPSRFRGGEGRDRGDRRGGYRKWEGEKGTGDSGGTGRDGRGRRREGEEGGEETPRNSKAAPA
jgi:hypothetical protein